MLSDWTDPATGAALDAAAALDRLAAARVVLLGERHDSARDHRWQAAVIAALAARRPALVVGIIGRGHLEYGHGTPAQLAALGIAPVRVALPAPPADAAMGTGPIADVIWNSRED